MGGSGSGSWRISKGAVEGELCLDVNKLKKLNFILNGSKSGSIHWKTYREKGSRIGYHYSDNDKVMKLSYSRNSESFFDRISLTKIVTNFGGHRWAFECPKCKRRAIKLYLVNSYFKCRICHNLTFSSSQESYMYRLVRKNHKLKDKLDGEIGVLRPKYMREKTYQNILDKIEEYDKEFVYQMYARYGVIL